MSEIERGKRRKRTKIHYNVSVKTQIERGKEEKKEQKDTIMCLLRQR